MFWQGYKRALCFHLISRCATASPQGEAFSGGEKGIRPPLRRRPGRGSDMPPACHSLPLPFESLFPISKRSSHPCGVTASFWRRERDSNPCPGIARLPHFECGPFDLLGISPCRPDIIQDAGVKSKRRFFHLFTYNLHLYLYNSIDKVCSRCYTVAMRKGKG